MILFVAFSIGQLWTQCCLFGVVWNGSYSAFVGTRVQLNFLYTTTYLANEGDPQKRLIGVSQSGRSFGHPKPKEQTNTKGTFQRLPRLYGPKLLARASKDYYCLVVSNQRQSSALHSAKPQYDKNVI